MLLDYLRQEKSSYLKGGLYHKMQIEMAYNSNRIEGSQLSKEQTRSIYETNTLGIEQNTSVNVDDIIETTNHFLAFDYLIDTAEHLLSEEWIKTAHQLLKQGTSDSRKPWFVVGDYKQIPNEVGGRETTLPEKVEREIEVLLEHYHSNKSITFETILDFHVQFERIHPFQDGNGRVGRLIMLKECLKHQITPFIITDDLKYFYYRGLNEWGDVNGYLIETCLSAQDRFKEYLRYFRVE